MIKHRPLEQLERDDLVRQALEAAAKRIEALHGNEKYEQAWKRAAGIIRGMIINGSMEVPDKSEQISSISTVRSAHEQ